mgnify:CR=1 FL=1
MPKILVVDDQKAVRQALQMLFEINDLECVCVDSPAAALERLETDDIDLVVQDMNFTQDTTSGREGVELGCGRPT